MKTTSLSFAVLILLAAAACHRQPNASATNAPAQDTAPEERGRSSHDPHAMTAIDVATGDLAGFANYAGGREWAPQPGHASAATAATATLPNLPLASVASGDEQVGEQSSEIMPTLSPSAPPSQTGPPGGPAGSAAP